MVQRPLAHHHSDLGRICLLNELGGRQAVLLLILRGTARVSPASAIEPCCASLLSSCAGPLVTQARSAATQVSFALTRADPWCPNCGTMVPLQQALCWPLLCHAGRDAPATAGLRPHPPGSAWLRQRPGWPASAPGAGPQRCACRGASWLGRRLPGGQPGQLRGGAPSPTAAAPAASGWAPCCLRLSPQLLPAHRLLPGLRCVPGARCKQEAPVQ